MLLLVGILCAIAFMIVGILGVWAAWMRSQRAAALPGLAARAGLKYSEVDVLNSAAVPFPLFREGDGRRIQHLIWRDAPGHPRVFEYGYYTEHENNNGQKYKRWSWFSCALVQHNGKWPELRLTRERLVDRAVQTLGLPDIELESEEFNRTYVVQCADAKFATDLLDPQMMEFILASKGLVDVQTKGRFLLLTTNQVQAEAMIGLLGMAEGIVERVPPLVWELYERFPDGMGTTDMPSPPASTKPGDRLGLFTPYEAPETRPWDFAPPPRLNARDDSWDPTPGIEHDLDGNPVPAVEENPWGDGRT
jgi:hypothetical protein